MFRWFLDLFKPQPSKIILFLDGRFEIQDQNQLQLSFISPTCDLKVKNIRLHVSLYHDWLPDIVIRLEHKERNITLLSTPFPPYEDCCGSINDWFQTNVFNGMDINGEWKIIVEDTQPGDSGELYYAELEITADKSCNQNDIVREQFRQSDEHKALGKKKKIYNERR